MQPVYGQDPTEADQDSKASSRDEFTYRQADKELLYQMVQYQLEGSNLVRTDNGLGPDQ